MSFVTDINYCSLFFNLGLSKEIEREIERDRVEVFIGIVYVPPREANNFESPVRRVHDPLLLRATLVYFHLAPRVSVRHPGHRRAL